MESITAPQKKISHIKNDVTMETFIFWGEIVTEATMPQAGFTYFGTR